MAVALEQGGRENGVGSLLYVFLCWTFQVSSFGLIPAMRTDPIVVLTLLLCFSNSRCSPLGLSWAIVVLEK